MRTRNRRRSDKASGVFYNDETSIMTAARPTLVYARTRPAENRPTIRRRPLLMLERFSNDPGIPQAFSLVTVSRRIFPAVCI
jgi:hypothetical protein